MPDIYFNDALVSIMEDYSLKLLLEEKKVNEPYFAVIVNNKLIPRLAYQNTVIQAGDRVDIIVPMQGG